MIGSCRRGFQWHRHGMLLGTVVVAVWSVVCQSAWALDYPLSPEHVREGYFLGHNPDVRILAGFLAKYSVSLPAHDSGPDVSLIEFQTPYEQVVLRSKDHPFNYHAPDAQQDYDSHPPEILVRVLIFPAATSSFSAPGVDASTSRSSTVPPEAYVRSFNFVVSQKHPIEAAEITARPYCPSKRCTSTGYEVLLHFDPTGFESEPVNVKVIAPGGQRFEANFDLDQLN